MRRLSDWYKFYQWSNPTPVTAFDGYVAITKSEGLAFSAVDNVYSRRSAAATVKSTSSPCIESPPSTRIPDAKASQAAQRTEVRQVSPVRVPVVRRVVEDAILRGVLVFELVFLFFFLRSG